MLLSGYSFLVKEEYRPSILYRNDRGDVTVEKTRFESIEQLLRLNVTKPAGDDLNSVRMTVTELLEHIRIENIKKSDLNYASKILQSMSITAQRSNGRTYRNIILKNV